MPLLDLKDERFGRLVVLKRNLLLGSSAGAYWDCRCDCGAETYARSDHLRKGRHVSCGCYRRDKWAAGKSKPLC